jgi:parallel beta-helix repeat protein
MLVLLCMLPILDNRIQPSAGTFTLAKAKQSETAAVPNPGGSIEKVTDFGAVGDGKTDDTEAIQSAVNQAGIEGGGTVYFPKGVYLLKSSILVRYDHVTLEGASWESELRLITHPQRVITIEKANDCIVRNLQISLGTTAASRNDQDEGIYVTSGSNHFLIEQVYGNKKGIMIRGDVSQGIIRGNTIMNTLADGIHITGGASQIQILNNTLENTGDDAISIVSYASENKFCEEIIIQGNQITHSQARGIAHIGGRNVDMINNRIDGTSSSGILVDQDLFYHSLPSYNTHISGNTITRSGTYLRKKGNQYGIEIAQGAKTVSIDGNIVQYGASRGMSISADSTEIRDNNVRFNADSGIQIDAEQCTIEGNQIISNGTYGFYSANSKKLKILHNVLVNNNEADKPYIDNLLLKDSDFSEVSGNQSLETRKVNQLERSIEIVGSCKELIYDKNTSKGTKLGALVQCSK